MMWLFASQTATGRRPNVASMWLSDAFRLTFSGHPRPAGVIGYSRLNTNGPVRPSPSRFAAYARGRYTSPRNVRVLILGVDRLEGCKVAARTSRASSRNPHGSMSEKLSRLGKL